jgi:hypothetical protein
MNDNKPYEKLKSTPGMWIIFVLFLAVSVGLTIFLTNQFLYRAGGEILSTKVFTIDQDVVSIKLPDDWDLDVTESTKSINFISGSGHESLSIASTKETDIKEASVMYMLELRNTFPDIDPNEMKYDENFTLNGKKAFATNIMYKGQYYLCGVMESGNTIIKFVYSTYSLTTEISDIDTIIGSINYRVGEKKSEVTK